MKYHLLAGSCLAGLTVANISSAVDITLGGSIDMGVEFGINKNSGKLTFSESFNRFTLSFGMGGTTDAGMKYGGSFSLGTTASIKFNPYVEGTKMYLGKATVEGASDIMAAVYNVSGGGAVAAADLVGVKINSSWRSVGDTRTDYVLSIAPSFVSSNICKLAGRGTVPSGLFAGPLNSTKKSEADAVTGSYLAVGQFARVDTTTIATGGAGSATPSVGGTLTTTRGATASITQTTNAAASFTNPAGAAASITRYHYLVKGAVDLDGGGTVTTDTVTDALIYAGPFMEVQMASSTTKMVVGAACIEGLNSSEAVFYLDNASKVMTASDASIFIEGGFGRLSLQTSDYGGAVAAIAGAGDQADISADGLVAIGESIGLLGANPFVAVDLAPTAAIAELELLAGASVNFGGLIAAFDLKVGTGDLIAVDTWDLGFGYEMGGLNVGFAADSNNDWGLAASMATNGFAVDAEFGATGNEDHQKSGIVYSIAGTTSLNGVGISLGLDQDMKTSFEVSYGLGGLNLYAGYDVADEGGAVGATLSF